MSESEQDRGVFIGRSVDMDRRIIRFSSVSQVKVFDPSPPGGGGCNRRWAFDKMFGVREEKTDVQTAGNKYATSLEHYLGTGVDALEAELRAAKHLLPRYDPARPIDCEWPLTFDVATGRAMDARRAELGAGFADARKRVGDEMFLQAVQLREMLLGPPRPGGDSPEQLRAMVKRAAKLVAGDVPMTGAADLRHTRGEYVDEDGTLKKEAPGAFVVETVDLKSTGNIFDRTTRPRAPNTVGTFYKGRAKTVEQILLDPQMLGYGEHSAEIYPEATHVRPGHIYIQTRGSPLGAKRSGLLTVEEVRERWRTRVVPIVREMEDVVRNADKPEDVPANLWACGAFHKACTYAEICVRQPTIYHLLVQAGELEQGDVPMNGVNSGDSGGLFDQLKKSDAVGAAPAALGGFFDEPAPSVVLSVAPVPALTEGERTRRVAAAEAALRAEDRVPCGATGCGVGAAPGWVWMGGGAHVVCPACGGAGAPAPAVDIGRVNPLDAAPITAANGAAVLPPEEVARITDPEILQRVQDHAAAAARAAADKAAADPKKEGGGGRCSFPASPDGQRMPIPEVMRSAVRGKKFFAVVCPSCGKETKAAPAADLLTAVVQGHLVPKTAVPAVPMPDAPAVPAQALPVGLFEQVPQVPPVAVPHQVPAVPPAPVQSASDKDTLVEQLRAENAVLRARIAEIARLAAV